MTHGIYLAKAGMVDLDFTGPKIEYDAATDTFDSTGASVKGRLDRDYLARVSAAEWLSATAKAFAGSGVAVEVLGNRLDNGDLGDRERFNKFFETARREHPHITVDLDALWVEARNCVQVDLELPTYREAILQGADELERLLFTLT